MRDAAVGTMMLQWMLFLAPSKATVFARPTNPIFAALSSIHSRYSYSNSVQALSSRDNSQNLRIICLPKVAVQTARTRCHNDAAVLLLLECLPSGLRTLEAALQMDIVHQIPVFVRDARKTAITQNASIIDQNIDTTEIIESRLNDFLAIDDGIVISHSDAA